MLILSKFYWSLGCRYFSINLKLFYVSFFLPPVQTLKIVTSPDIEYIIFVYVLWYQLFEPYGAGSIPIQSDRTELKYNIKLQGRSEKVGSSIRASSLRCMSPDYDTKEIKNIYMDCKFYFISTFPSISVESYINFRSMSVWWFDEV